tara:strand:- start:5272 stop:6144 length:873 start_codon:yes stop_codon:yes gene_type:complete
MSTDPRILMAQHAKTAELLGVDFLPLGEVPTVMAQPTADVAPPTPSRSPQPTQAPVSVPPAHPPAQANPDSELASIPAAAAQALQGAYASESDAQARLDALRAKYELDAPHAHFNTAFSNIVFGEGDPQAQLMFIGEAPGEDEDRTGRPFVGRAGQLLENMIKAMGVTREQVYITNVLKTRPPNNATPTKEQARLCEPYLVEQVRIIEPKAIVTLGLSASQLILKSQSPMRTLRGHWHPWPTSPESEGLGKIEIMPTYHPAYLLRSYTEDNRRKVWSDLTQVIDKLGLKN